MLLLFLMALGCWPFCRQTPHSDNCCEKNTIKQGVLFFFLAVLGWSLLPKQQKQNNKQQNNKTTKQQTNTTNKQQTQNNTNKTINKQTNKQRPGLNT